MVEVPGYQILRELGASDRASVYLAVQESLERNVALKVMAPTLAEDPAFAKRFLHEARALASLAHPHIVAVYDVDAEAGNVLFFSMQYLPGGDLVARVRNGIDENALVAILDGIAQALDYVHQRGLIHRDVSPSNVLFDAGDAPVLTDFGISRAIGPAAGSTATNFAASTGHYMSPEQARGANIDARADIYSLGALAYFGLTGKPPFDGPDGFAVAYAHVFEPIPKLPPARAHWQKLIDGALAKDPTQRFASAAEFIAALGVAASGPVAVVAAAPASASKPAALEPEPEPERIEPALVGPASIKPAPLETSPSDATVADDTIDAPSPATAYNARDEVEPGGATIQRELPPPLAAAVLAAQAPSGETPAHRNLHVFPLLLIAVGILAIAAAVYTQFFRRNANDSAAVIAPVAATTGASSAAPPVASATPADAGASVSNGANTTGSNPPEIVPPPADSSAVTDTTTASDEFSDVTDLSKVPTVVDPFIEAIRLGRVSLAAQRLTTPPGNNALEYFQFALKRDGKSKYAKQGILDVAKKLVDNADKSQAGGDLNAYLQLLGSADDVAKPFEEAADLRKGIAARRAKAAEPYLAQARAAAAEWDKGAAKAAYDKALQIDPANSAAADGLKFVATIGEPGFVFHDKLGDASAGPQLIVLGNGKIAVALRDVTRGEFRRYWSAAGRAAFAGKEPGCRDRESFFRSSKDRNWQNPGFEQDDSHPVVCVNWLEAAGYAQWLSRETGKRYRLLSAAEFDQLTPRAAADCTAANLADAAFNKKYASRDGATCDDGFAETAPVGHFPANGGIYDASGNVRVWVAACGNGAAVPASGVCRDYLAKGRAWLSTPKESPTFADSFGADVALNSVGFRIVREIEK